MNCRNRFLLLSMLLLTGTFTTLHAQDDKSKRPSPLLEAKATPYGEVWRTGANEATTFEVNKDVEIEGQKLSAGKYSLFTIPGEKEWTLIFNKEASQWGAYNYKVEEDALRVTLKPEKVKEMSERLTFKINEKAGKVTLYWENIAVPFTVKTPKI